MFGFYSCRLLVIASVWMLWTLCGLESLVAITKFGQIFHKLQLIS